MNELELAQISLTNLKTDTLQSNEEKVEEFENLFNVISPALDPEELVTELISACSREKSQAHIFAIVVKLVKTSTAFEFADSEIASLLELYLKEQVDFVRLYFRKLLFSQYNSEKTLKIFEKAYLALFDQYWLSSGYVDCLVQLCKVSFDKFAKNIHRIQQMLFCNLGKNGALAYSCIASLMLVDDKYQTRMARMLEEGRTLKHLLGKREFKSTISLITELICATEDADLFMRNIEQFKHAGHFAIPYLCRICAHLCFGLSIFALEHKSLASIRNERVMDCYLECTAELKRWKHEFREMGSLSHRQLYFFNLWLPEQDQADDQALELYFEVLPSAPTISSTEWLTTEHTFFLARLAACNPRYFATKTKFYLVCMLQLNSVRIRDNQLLNDILSLNSRYYIVSVVRRPYCENYLSVMYTPGRNLTEENFLLSKSDTNKYFGEISKWTIISGGIVDLILDVWTRYLFIITVDEKEDVIDDILWEIHRMLTENIILETNERFEYTLIVIFLLKGCEGCRGALIADIIDQYRELLYRLQVASTNAFLECFISRRRLVSFIESRSMESLNMFVYDYLAKCSIKDVGESNILIITLFLNKMEFKDELIPYLSGVISRYLRELRSFELMDELFPELNMDGLEKIQANKLSGESPLWNYGESTIDCTTRHTSNIMRIYKTLVESNQFESVAFLLDRMFSSYIVLLNELPFCNFHFMEDKAEMSNLIKDFMSGDSLLVAFHGLVHAVERGSANIAIKYALPFLRLLNLIPGVEALNDALAGSLFAQEVADTGDQLEIPFSEIVQYCYSSKFIGFLTDVPALEPDDELVIAALLARRLFLRNYYIFKFRTITGFREVFEPFKALHQANRFKTVDEPILKNVFDFYSSNIELIGSALSVCFCEEMLTHTMKLEDITDLILSIVRLKIPELVEFVLRCLTERKNLRFDDCDYYFVDQRLLGQGTGHLFCISRRDFLAFEDVLRCCDGIDWEYVSRMRSEAEMHFLAVLYFRRHSRLVDSYFFVSTLLTLRSFFKAQSQAKRLLETRIAELIEANNDDYFPEAKRIVYLPGVLHLLKLMGDNPYTLRNMLSERQIERGKQLLSEYNELCFTLEGVIPEYLPFSPSKAGNSEDDNEEAEKGVFNTVFINRELLVDELQLIDTIDSEDLFLFFKREYTRDRSIFRQLLYFIVQLYSENSNFIDSIQHNQPETFEKVFCSSECQVDGQIAITPLLACEFDIRRKYVFKTTFRLSWLEELIVFMASIDLRTILLTFLEFIGDVGSITHQSDQECVVENYEYITGYIARHLIAEICSIYYDEALNEGLLFSCICAVMKRGCYTDMLFSMHDSPLVQAQYFVSQMLPQTLFLKHDKYELMCSILNQQVTEFPNFMEAICLKFPEELLSKICFKLLRLEVEYSIFLGHDTPWIDSESYSSAINEEVSNQMLYEIPRILSDVELCSLHNKTEALRACYYLLRYLIKRGVVFSVEDISLLFEFNCNIQSMVLVVQHQAMVEILQLAHRITYALSYAAILASVDHFQLVLRFIKRSSMLPHMLCQVAVVVLLACEFFDINEHELEWNALLSFLNELEAEVFINLADLVSNSQVLEETRKFLLECGVRHQASECDASNLRMLLEGHSNSATEWLELLISNNFKSGRPQPERAENYFRTCMELSCSSIGIDHSLLEFARDEECLPSLGLVFYYEFSVPQLRILLAILLLHCYFHECREFQNQVMVLELLQSRSLGESVQTERLVAKLYSIEYSSDDLLEGNFIGVEQLFEQLGIEINESTITFIWEIAKYRALCLPCLVALAWIVKAHGKEKEIRETVFTANYIPEWGSNRRLFEHVKCICADFGIELPSCGERVKLEDLKDLYMNPTTQM